MSNEQKTFEDFKEEIAQKYGYKSWSKIDWYREDVTNEIIKPPYSEELYLNESAEAYASYREAQALDKVYKRFHDERRCTSTGLKEIIDEIKKEL